MKSHCKGLFWLVLLCLFAVDSSAQDLTDDVKSWFGYSLNVRFGKRFKVKVGQLYSIDIAATRFGFAQTDLIFSYKLAPRNYIQLEYSNAQYRWFDRLRELGFSRNTLSLVGYQRFTLAYNGSHRIFKKKRHRLYLKHYAISQIFFPQPEKHRLRFIYTARLYYRNSKWPLKLQPYIANSLYYYWGGRPIAYHNEQGEVIAYNSPNGFHRIRIKAGASFVPIKKVPLTVTLYFIAQWEFNNYLFPNQHINYQKPAPLDDITYPFEPLSIDTEMPFNNYMTIGLHLSYTIKVRIKKKKNAKRN